MDMLIKADDYKTMQRQLEHLQKNCDVLGQLMACMLIRHNLMPTFTEQEIEGCRGLELVVKITPENTLVAGVAGLTQEQAQGHMTNHNVPAAMAMALALQMWKNGASEMTYQQHEIESMLAAESAVSVGLIPAYTGHWPTVAEGENDDRLIHLKLLFRRIDDVGHG